MRLVAAAEHRLDRHVARRERGEDARPLVDRRLALPPVQHGQPLRADEVRRKHGAQLAIDLREDHVEVDRRVFLRHHDDDDVAHFGLLEQARRELIDRRGTRALAEADDDQVAAKRMDVAALERVVHPSLRRAVVQNARIGELRMVREQRLHDDRFGPPDRVAHRADQHVLAGDDAAVAREEQVGQRRQHVAVLVERLGERAGRLVAALDEHADQRVGVELADVAGQRLGRNDVHRLADRGARATRRWRACRPGASEPGRPS